jgi:hypothetical protein
MVWTSEPKRFSRWFLLLAIALGLAPALTAQAPDNRPAPLEKVGPNEFRIGRIKVDTASRQVTVPGRVNENVLQLEFIANTQGGNKAYESALTLSTNATTFNAALLLIGLDPARARNVPKFHFDPATPQGDEVEIWVECPNRECQRFPAERLMYDKEKNQQLGGGSWVYTGSAFSQDGLFLAERDGVLIGFVHDPSSIIEYTGSGALGRFGRIVTNPGLGIKDGTEVIVTVKAVSPAR